MVFFNKAHPWLHITIWYNHYLWTLWPSFHFPNIRQKTNVIIDVSVDSHIYSNLRDINWSTLTHSIYSIYRSMAWDTPTLAWGLWFFYRKFVCVRFLSVNIITIDSRMQTIDNPSQAIEMDGGKYLQGRFWSLINVQANAWRIWHSVAEIPH